MFYNEGLRSGIAVALQEAKSVACFVTDDGNESATWQNEYLADEQVLGALRAKAITLHIEAGSEEANFLSAYYSIAVTPSLIVIHNGRLLLDIRAGVSQHEFKAALLRALTSPSSGPSPAPAPPTPSGESSSTADRTQIKSQEASYQQKPLSNEADDHPTERSASEGAGDTILGETDNTANAATPISGSPSRSPVEKLLAERRQRLEKKKREDEETLKAERKAKAKEKEAELHSDPRSTVTKQAHYAKQQRQRQKEAKLERERVLRLIKHDKAERKEKEEQRKQAMVVESAKATGADTVDTEPHPSGSEIARHQSLGHRSASLSKDCALQIRLFDGRTLRSRFSSNDTLGLSVRAWLDVERSDGDAPYTMKQILTPAPSRNLSVSDEALTLQELGLVPSSTLVLVPTKSYAAAYSARGSLFANSVSNCYNAVASTFRFILNALLALLAWLQIMSPKADDQKRHVNVQPVGAQTPAQATSSGTRVHRLNDQRPEKDETQLYNGNQLNFEPRKDDEEKG